MKMRNAKHLCYSARLTKCTDDIDSIPRGRKNVTQWLLRHGEQVNAFSHTSLKTNQTERRVWINAKLHLKKRFLVYYIIYQKNIDAFDELKMIEQRHSSSLKLKKPYCLEDGTTASIQRQNLLFSNLHEDHAETEGRQWMKCSMN